jgi:hypothetical protein
VQRHGSRQRHEERKPESDAKEAQPSGDSRGTRKSAALTDGRYTAIVHTPASAAGHAFAQDNHRLSQNLQSVPTRDFRVNHWRRHRRHDYPKLAPIQTVRILHCRIGDERAYVVRRRLE